MLTEKELTLLLNKLQVLLDAIPAEIDIDGLSSARLKSLQTKFQEYANKLYNLSRKLDPIHFPQVVFDPSDPFVVGKLISYTLLEQPRHKLGSVHPFYGSGIYAIYYNGSFGAYKPISKTENPIYVGKADPESHDAKSPEEQGEKLSIRLKDHAKSVTNAKNIDIANFECRYLVVKSAWQKTSEDYLINLFKPIWNNEVGICYGFGKHGDSSSTRKNTRSPWDTLHPGRPWATEKGNVINPKSVSQIKGEIAKHYKKNPPIDLDKLIYSFSK